MKKKRIGVIGGSFDPIHLGHLIIGQDAIDQLGLSELIYMPASIPPHKQGQERVAAEHRLKMVELAVKDNPSFSVSDMEILRSGVSYTIDTVRQLRSIYADCEIILIIGSDTLVDLHNWHEIEPLLSLCDFATFLRPGEESLEVIAKKVELKQVFKKRLLENIIEAHRIEISSTDIRQRIKAGHGIRYLVPRDVEKYIDENSLYQG